MNMGTEKEQDFTPANAKTQKNPSGNYLHTLQNALTTHRLKKRGALLYWAILLTLSAATIHTVGIVKQLPQSVLLAILLICFTLMQFIIAIVVVAIPSRRLLLTAVIVEIIGMLTWIVGYNIGLPDGFAIWRAEMLWVPDLYLPVIEGLSAAFFLALYGRTWTFERGIIRTILRFFPSLLILALLIWIALHSIYAVVFFLVPGVLFTSLQYLFLPLVGLLAIFLILRLLIQPLRTKTKGALRTAFILLPALLFISLITWGGGVSATSAAWLSSSPSINVPVNQTKTLTYCNTSNGSPLAMDLSEPSTQASRPAPVVFYIHGGETLVGSRILDDGSSESQYLIQLRTDLLRRGFVVGSIDYGLVPFYTVRDQVKAAKCAVRFLRTYATQLGIDPQRIGVYGDSEGGYLSAMLGTLGSDTTSYDVGQYLNQSSSVQSVVDMWGPTDLSNFSGSPSWISLIVGRATPALLRNASPAYYVAHSDPPFLIIHGTDDWFIAPHHSQDMAKRLQAAGVPITLVMIQQDGHGLASPTAGQVEEPSPATLVQMIVDFFGRTLQA